MAMEKREIYASPNGDRWSLVQDIDLGQVFIWHEPNASSGGQATRIEVGVFLVRNSHGPEHQELLRLLGTLVAAAPLPGTETARIKSHAKSHIVDLTDGSRWRVWPGDLAMTLGSTSEADIEVLPVDDEFCSHVLVDQTDGSKVRVIDASSDWPLEKLRHSLQGG
jgi:hypothetical protein